MLKIVMLRDREATFYLEDIYIHVCMCGSVYSIFIFEYAYSFITLNILF